MIARDPLGTWETLRFPSSKAAGDTAHQLPIDPRLRARGRGGTNNGQRPGIAKRRKRSAATKDGRESQRLSNGAEAGERALRTPWSEGGAASWRGVEPCRGHRASKAYHRKTAWPCEGQRSHDVTNRCGKSARPALWELWGATPRATRPPAAEISASRTTMARFGSPAAHLSLHVYMF